MENNKRLIEIERQREGLRIEDGSKGRDITKMGKEKR